MMPTRFGLVRPAIADNVISNVKPVVATPASIDKGRGDRRGQHVYARADRGHRAAQRPPPGRRAGADGRQRGAARTDRRPVLGGSCATRLAGPHHHHSVARRGGRWRLFRPGPAAHRRSAGTADRRDVPPRFGTIGQETTGAGGFAKALRTVPVVLELARAGRSPRRARRVDGRLHQPRRDRHPGAARWRTPRRRPVQRGDRSAAATGGALRSRRRTTCSSATWGSTT